MKYFIPAAFLLCILIFPSCKKNADNVPTGLETLADPKADNYCILDIDGDTVIWESTLSNNYSWPHSDTITDGGVFYQRLISDYSPPTMNAEYTGFWLEFRTPHSSSEADEFECSLMNTMIYNGNVAIKVNSAIIALFNNYGLGTSTEYTEDLPPATSGPETLQVESITKIPESNGCYTYRVKAKVSNIQFGAYGCKVPAHTIRQGVVQMDFKMQ